MKKFRKIFCALFRHSNIEKACFGYIHCCRCGEQVGDTIGGCYKNPLVVGMHCACEDCEKNLEELTFVDTFLVPPIPWRGNRIQWKTEENEKHKSAMEALGRIQGNAATN